MAAYIAGRWSGIGGAALRSKSAGISLSCVIVAWCNCVGAQQLPASDGASRPQTETLEEVVVSAEKRESTVQNTPISISAITGADLQDRGLTDLLSVAQETAGVSFKSAGPGQTEFEIRGLTSSGGFSPTVGFYLDDVPLTAPAQAYEGKVVIDPSLYDLNRIEVLRGPQGTLYGSGSMGGTIKLLSNAPVLNKFHASGEATGSDTLGGGFNRDINAMVNIPIVNDIAAVRLVGTDRNTSGWIDRIVLNPFPLEPVNPDGSFAGRGNVAAAPVAKVIPDVNWEHLIGGRATLLLQLSDRLTITAGVMHQRIDTGGESTIDNPPGNQEAHYQPFDLAEPGQDTFTLYNGTIKYSFDQFELTSATSKWNRSDSSDQDIAEPMQMLFVLPAYTTAGGGVGPGIITMSDATSQFSQEVRLASTGDGAVQWLIGGFYSNFNSNTRFHSLYDGFTALFGTNDLAIIDQPISIKQTAAFGEASYKITPRLKATAGLRWYTYRSAESNTLSGLATLASGPGVVTSHEESSNHGQSPKVTLSYSVADDSMVYATAARGFRPGGVNQPLPLSGPLQCLTGAGNSIDLGFPTVPNQFNPDTVWSYELGNKARGLGGHITLNSDVYYEKWQNVQQQITPACGFPFTANAGNAAVYGSEVELNARVSGWTFSENLGYTHATFTDAVVPSIQGTKILDIPNVTSNSSLAYMMPVSAEHRLTGRLTYSYVGPREDVTFTRNYLPGYGLLNSRLGIETDAWSAVFFVDNLTDRHALLTNTNAHSANVEFLNRVATNAPRTWGLTLSFRY